MCTWINKWPSLGIKESRVGFMNEISSRLHVRIFLFFIKLADKPLGSVLHVLDRKKKLNVYMCVVTRTGSYLLTQLWQFFSEKFKLFHKRDSRVKCVNVINLSLYQNALYINGIQIYIFFYQINSRACFTCACNNFFLPKKRNTLNTRLFIAFRESFLVISFYDRVAQEKWIKWKF